MKQAIPSLLRAGIALGAVTLLAAAGHAQTNVLVENFDTSTNPYLGTGNAAGAITGYTLAAAGSTTGPGDYRIVTDPGTSFANSFTSYGDHTTGTGQMLFVDGSNNTSLAVWTDTLTLSTDEQYTFSFWGSAASSDSTPVFQAYVDGQLFGSAGNLQTSDGVWSNYSDSFTVDTNGEHTLTIVDTNGNGTGNDGAIDDIVVTASAPEPSAALLLAPGVVGLLGFARRRRQRAA